VNPKAFEDVWVGLNTMLFSLFSLNVEVLDAIPSVIVLFSLKKRSYFSDSTLFRYL
jgi:hypothetical protein